MTASDTANASDLLRSRILDSALELGEQRGWDAVHLHDIAQVMGITMADIRRHYQQKDSIAEAWFDRADDALLAMPVTPGWDDLTVTQRLHGSLFAWLNALAPHRRITAAMLRYKLQPDHLHLQVLGIMRVSRTVQWIREVALLRSAGWRREVEEAALTGIFLSTFAYWLNDDSSGVAGTHAYLGRLLAIAERVTLQVPLGR